MRSWRFRVLPVITHKPILAAIAAKLAGCEEIRLWHDQLLLKPPQREDREVNGLTTVGWHTDRHYWRSCTGPLLTAWVPFTEVTPEMGPITYLDRSNSWQEIAGLNFFSDDLASQEAIISKESNGAQKIIPHFKRGQIGFHDWRTVHGSAPNVSEQDRRGMAVHLQHGENRWQEHRNEHGDISKHATDYLLELDSDGPPDYQNEKWFPKLWPR